MSPEPKHFKGNRDATKYLLNFIEKNKSKFPSYVAQSQAMQELQWKLIQAAKEIGGDDYIVPEGYEVD